MKLSVHSPNELAAAIPHLLGFKPEESVVFVPMSADLPIARIDLPTTPRDRDAAWEAIRSPLGRYARPRASVGIVCVTADREEADRVVADPGFTLRTHTHLMPTSGERTRKAIDSILSHTPLDETRQTGIRHPPSPPLGASAAVNAERRVRAWNRTSPP